MNNIKIKTLICSVILGMGTYCQIQAEVFDEIEINDPTAGILTIKYINKLGGWGINTSNQRDIYFTNNDASKKDGAVYMGDLYTGYLNASKLAIGNTEKTHLGISTNSSDNSMVISSIKKSGKATKLKFSASGYVFEEGNAKFNGSIECQKEMRVTKIDAKDIRTNDITVDMSNAADYVFDEDYDLKSLEDVETYVKTNKHLPGIPTASEMAQNGMSLAEMSNLLLEKVEELTLHMIELEKENKALKKQMEAMVK